MKTRIKTNGFIIFCVLLLIGLFPDIFFRSGKNYPFEVSLGISGITLILLGQLLRISARGFKSENSHNGHRLLQNGPYALVRNPMYLGILLIGMGIVLMLFKWWAGGIFLLVFILRYVMLIFKEEKKLQLAFPDDFAAYQKQAPRIFPKMSLLLKDDLAGYLPLKFSWIKKEIGSISTVLCATFLIKSWQVIIRQGIGAYLSQLITYLCVMILFVGVAGYLNRQTLARERAC